MLLIVVYVATVVPIRIAFMTDSHTWIVTDYIIDAIFLVDIVLNFITID